MSDSPLKALKEERSSVANGIANTKAHLQRLQEQLATLDKAISNLEPFYEAGGPIWAPIIGENAPGITDAVRMIFRSHATIHLAPTAIRDALKKDGLIKGYDNEMAVIHQVIRRLEDQGQLEPHPVEKAYRWVSAAEQLGRAAQGAAGRLQQLASANKIARTEPPPGAPSPKGRLTGPPPVKK
jgi:hypothetical protein